jgi:hypothetical protein
MKKLVEVLGLSNVNYVTHDEVRCIHKNGVFNLDTVDFLEIESDHNVNDTNEKLIKRFISKHPDWRVMVPYGGYVFYFFSKEPEHNPIDKQNRLHNGATGICKNCFKNSLIILDMD